MVKSADLTEYHQVLKSFFNRILTEVSLIIELDGSVKCWLIMVKSAFLTEYNQVLTVMFLTEL